MCGYICICMYICTYWYVFAYTVYSLVYACALSTILQPPYLVTSGKDFVFLWIYVFCCCVVLFCFSKDKKVTANSQLLIKWTDNNFHNQLIVTYKENCQSFIGFGFLNVSICWFSLFYIFVNQIFWGFGLLVGDIILGSEELSFVIYHYFLTF